MASKKTSNFKVALNELLAGKSAVEEASLEQNKKEAVEKAVETVLSKTKTVAEKTGETVIAEDVVIEGNINTSSKLRVVGKVTGSITSTEDILIEGTIGGEINGKSVYFNSGETNSNITASYEVRISEKCVVNGDVKADIISNAGFITGNLSAVNVELTQNSRTVGNIKCKTIKIIEGACIQGNMETIK